MDNRFLTPYSHPRWWWEGSYIPICFSCAHFKGLIQGKMRCQAFPEGIPQELTAKGARHDTQFPGDHGILYQEQKDLI